MNNKRKATRPVLIVALFLGNVFKLITSQNHYYWQPSTFPFRLLSSISLLTNSIKEINPSKIVNGNGGTSTTF